MYLDLLFTFREKVHLNLILAKILCLISRNILAVNFKEKMCRLHSTNLVSLESGGCWITEILPLNTPETGTNSLMIGAVLTLLSQ